MNSVRLVEISKQMPASKTHHSCTCMFVFICIALQLVIVFIIIIWCFTLQGKVKDNTTVNNVFQHYRDSNSSFLNCLLGTKSRQFPFQSDQNSICWPWTLDLQHPVFKTNLLSVKELNRRTLQVHEKWY